MGRRGPAGPVCSEPRPNGPSRTCRSGLLRATLRFRPPAKCQSPADRLTGVEWQPDGGTIAVRPFCVRLDASKVTKVTGSEVTARKSPNRGAPSPPGRAASALTPQQGNHSPQAAQARRSGAHQRAPHSLRNGIGLPEQERLRARPSLTQILQSRCHCSSWKDETTTGIHRGHRNTFVAPRAADIEKKQIALVLHIGHRPV
jgi:hypothetical protein